jgi:hypothetical protein
VTLKDATSAGAVDVADSDASLVGSDAVIAYTTGSAGQNNHTLDFGFKVGCVLPTVGTNTPAVGTCTGTTPNDDAKIDFTGFTNADKAEKFEGATYSGAAYSAATGTVTTGAVSFTGLKHNTQYTFRFWNAADACFVDVTVKTPAKTCGVVTPIDPCATPPTGAVAASCINTRLMATPVYTNGDPLAGGTTATAKGIAIFEETNFGENTPYQKSVMTSEVGTVWGLAYKNQNNTLYASSFLKRHAGLGANGTGAIYQVSPSSATPTGSLFVDLSTLGVNTGANPRVPTVGTVDNPNELSADLANPSWDVAAFDLIGKTSLGGLDVSTDGTKMYVMNLQERELVVLNTSGGVPTLIGKYPIPNPNCSNGEFRPWAVKYHNGKVYVGVVCSAETSQLASDLKATILEFDGTNFCNVHNFSLDYPRGIAGGAGGQLIDPAEWKPWTSTWQSVSATFASDGTVIYPQPILSDIEFDMDGSMVLAFLDRNGHQTGVVNYKPDMSSTQTFVGQTAGDILRVGLVGGVYQLENNGQINGVQAEAPGCFSPTPTNSGLNNQQGPGGGEYYWSDNYALNPCNTSAAGIHQEISYGGLAFVPGSGEIAMTGMDPTQSANSGGVSWFNNTTGKRRVDAANQFDATLHGYRLYDQALPGSFGKAAGLGDLEVFCSSTCTPPTAGTNTPAAGTCTGATANDDAKIDFTGFTNADKAEKSEGATYSGAAYSAATGTVIAGAVSFTGLKHNTQYTFRFWNAADACFVDVTITTPTKTCTPTCTQPTAGTNTPAAGTCTGATPNNDAKVDFVGITNADKAEKSEGATYSGAAYSAATGTVTGGAVSFTGLKDNTQYTFRFWNAADACFVDVTITTPTKTCAVPCPPKICTPVKVTKL